MPLGARLLAYLEAAGPTNPATIAVDLKVPMGNIVELLRRQPDVYAKLPDGKWRIRPKETNE